MTHVQTIIQEFSTLNRESLTLILNEAGKALAKLPANELQANSRLTAEESLLDMMPLD